MKPFSILTAAALLAATLGTAAAAHTTVITGAPALRHVHSVVTPRALHLPPRHLHPVVVPHLHPRPVPLPLPACLSCPPVPYYDVPFHPMPRVIMR